MLSEQVRVMEIINNDVDKVAAFDATESLCLTEFASFGEILNTERRIWKPPMQMTIGVLYR
jgi:hypothetical protein